MQLKVKFSLLIPILLVAVAGYSQIPKASVTLTSSNLPIVFIKSSGAPIRKSPYVDAYMKVIDNEDDEINKVTDPINGYNGNILIKTRGSWTAQYEQKSYSIKTVDAQGVNLNDKLLGMKSEHKWAAYAPYDDRTFMCNPLAFKLSREMGQWAPRTRFCEIMLDTGFGYRYNGVYVMMEKIKRDKKRVDIADLDGDDNAGDSLTGGYIISIDSNINEPDSGFTTKNSPKLFIRYVYPDGDKITDPQKKYIQRYLDTVENSLKASNFADPDNGYRKYLDEFSFIDFFIIQELSKNLDGFKRSAYMYKDRFSNGGKLHAGPQWDFNSAWGNSANNSGPLGVCDYDKPEGWVYENTTCWIHLFNNFPVPFYWKRLHEDPEFVHHLKCRWMQLRENYLSKSYIMGQIDSMQAYASSASVRQATRYDFNYSYSAGVDSLKSWINARIDWMDANMPGSCLDIGIEENTSIDNSLGIFPNPASTTFTVKFEVKKEENLSIILMNALGSSLYSIDAANYAKGMHQIEISTAGFASGIYYLKLQSGTSVSVKKIVVEN